MRNLFKYLPIALIVSLSLATTGCKPEPKQAESAQPTTSQLDVTFQTSPKKVEPHQPTELMASVKQNGKVVKGGKILFHIWKEGDKEREKLETTFDGKGFYRAIKSFPHAGTYQYTICSTANGTHKMVDGTLQVGTDAHAHHQKHSDSKMMVHVMLPKTAKAAQPASIMVHTKEGAKVSLNYGYESEKNLQEAILKSTARGEYKTNITFPKKGKVTLTITVEKGEDKESKKEVLTIQ